MKKIIYIFIYLVFITKIFAINLDYHPYIIDYDNLVAIKPKNIEKGNIKKGKEIFISRKVNCLSCHSAPIPEEKFHGNFGPSLNGIGRKLSKEEIRIRLINFKIISENSIMPSYFKRLDYPRIPDHLINSTILSVEEVEHLVEYLYSVK
tara:strand:+ start:64 stop:510 length:447 start_codon:yes stop_codon:yes gene_type:complete